MKNKYNYSFNDVLELLGNDSYNIWDDTGSNILKDIIENVVSNSVMASLSNVGYYDANLELVYNAHISSLLDNLYRLHEENYCVFVDSTDETENASKRFLIKFLTLINQTAPRYTKLLSLYAAQEAHLLDKLETSNTGFAKFNDTPQGSGDFADDTHATNVTNTTSTTQIEVKTPIERLKEIQESYSDLIARWSEEFDGLFMEEGNLIYEN